MNQPETRTIATPGAVLTYDVRRGDGPVLLLVGSPMQAEGFTTLAGHFADRTVVTYDPRGIARSERTDGATESTPDEHAEDLAAVIAEIGGGPVDVFASSGGAVNALALVARRPGLVRTLVAHEPPTLEVLSDRATATAATADIYETYQKSGAGPAMVKFFLLTGAKGEIPAGWADQPAPDPAQFGLPTEDTGERDDPLLGQNLMTCTHYEHDYDALRAAPTRIVVAVGAESVGELAHRGGEGVAARLGVEPVTFPSHHGGFLGGEFGMTGDPDGFAAALREALR
ncbi:hydrolase [Paractinoplanes deccanensis]|uniref:Hydrolase n=1 Tax=Paractinoplanes deccanensis TaxID=113561 RepID=A0ABQ3YHW6_9ACTN|nr:alpha/beta hydrolase [Actinoplanes deccanensis]GID79567.1 hydrolase [Actinoplanes deccanensis]